MTFRNTTLPIILTIPAVLLTYALTEKLSTRNYTAHIKKLTQDLKELSTTHDELDRLTILALKSEQRAIKAEQQASKAERALTRLQNQKIAKKD